MALDTPQSDPRLPPGAAAGYLAGKFDQLAAALRDHNWVAARAVVQSIVDDGYPTVADHVEDGLIAAGLAGLVGGDQNHPR